MFEQQFFCKKVSPNRYIYPDGEVAYILSRKMNFTPIYVQDPKSVTYGKEEDNGLFSGALGAIEYGTADIATNIRIITNMYKAENVLFLRPIGSLKMNYLVPNNYLSKEFLVFPWNFFEIPALIVYIFIFIVFVIVNYILQQYHFSYDLQETTFNLPGIIITIFGICHNIAVTAKLMTTRKRLLLGTAFLYTVFLSSIYQGSIVNELDKFGDERNIKTLEQLLLTPLRLLIHDDLAVHIEYFRDLSDSNIFKQLYKRHEIIEHKAFDPSLMVAFNRTAALLTLDIYIPRHKWKLYNKEYGEHRVTKLPVPVREFFQSIIIPKHSPFIEEINRLIGRMESSGLIRRQEKMAFSDLMLGYIQFSKMGYHQHRDIKVLTFSKLTMLFSYLVVSYSVIFVVFLCEILWKRRNIMLKHIVLEDEK